MTFFKFTETALALILLYSTCAANGGKLIEAKILLNGKPHGAFGVMLVNGMGYIKTADAANIFSLKAEWVPEKKSIKLVNGQNENVRLFMKSTKVYIKNRLYTLRKEPQLFSGKSWLPLELVLTKSFQGFAGVRARWDYKRRILALSPEGSAPPEIPELKAAPEKKPVKEVSAPVIKKALPSYKRKARKIWTIVIDPGHGGKDPGACSVYGYMEKNFTLDIAKRLYKILKADPSFKQILTRRTDIFIPLRTRTLIANRAHADLFISIHINASYRKSTRGFEVYFLSGKASDAESQAVANTENAVVEMESKTSYKTPTNSILWSMKLNEYMNESAEFCAFISRDAGKLFKYKRGAGHGVKQAGFYVLKGARMPAVLAECGFITNRKDLRFLKKSRNRQEIAQNLYDAIVQYRDWSKKGI